MKPENYHNKHKGPCIVVANGPSLTDVPVEFFDKYPTIGCNHFGCACEHTFYHPTYWSQLGLDQVDTEEKRKHYYPAIENAELAFVNRAMRDKFPQENIVGILGRDETGFKQGRAFSIDILSRVGVGYTQIYISLQIAYWLGFTTALLVGLDNDYNADPGKRHFYEDKEHNSCEPFHGNEGAKLGSDFVLGLARAAFEADNRRIYNLTPTKNTPSLRMGKLRDWYGS